MKSKKRLKKLIKEMRKFETDLKEVKIGADLDYQCKRLKKTLDDYDPPQPIHGGGTGTR